MSANSAKTVPTPRRRRALGGAVFVVMAALGIAANAATVPESVRANEQGRQSAVPMLAAEKVRADIATLRHDLAERWAHASHPRAAAVAASLDSLAAGADTGLTVDDLGRALRRALALSADPHAGVRGFDWPAGALPFLVEPVAGDVVAILPDRRAFVGGGRPFLASIDGVPLERWLAAAQRYVPGGSPAHIRGEAVALLPRIALLREELGMPARGEIAITVRGEGALGDSTLTVPLSDEPPRSAPWPNRLPEELEGGWSYLGWRALYRRGEDQIESWMSRMSGSRGIILDLRGATGGDLTAVAALVPYLSWRDDPPRVAAVVRCRSARFADPRACPQRPLWREGEEFVADPELQRALAAFAAVITDSLPDPAAQLGRPSPLDGAGGAAPIAFDPARYLVLQKRPEDDRYVFDRPVAVIVDGACFGAANLALAVLESLPRVTLLGAPTAGGHGFVTSVRLPHSDLLVTFATAAVRLGDGTAPSAAGITPDRPLREDPTARLQGQPDGWVEAARQFLHLRR